MEEQKRYKVYKDNRENSYICDTSKNVDYKTYQEFVDLLNQQDKHIKELEEENKECKHWENMFHKLSTDSDTYVMSEAKEYWLKNFMIENVDTKIFTVKTDDTVCLHTYESPLLKSIEQKTDVTTTKFRNYQTIILNELNRLLALLETTKYNEHKDL